MKRMLLGVVVLMLAGIAFSGTASAQCSGIRCGSYVYCSAVLDIWGYTFTTGDGTSDADIHGSGTDMGCADDCNQWPCMFSATCSTKQTKYGESRFADKKGRGVVIVTHLTRAEMFSLMALVNLYSPNGELSPKQLAARIRLNFGRGHKVSAMTGEQFNQMRQSELAAYRQRKG